MADTNVKDRLKDITDSIEKGIKELFQSDKYAQYLQTMSRFHRYSVNNVMLIFMQKPDASLCAGFNAWRDKFERNVKKGEKGIKIIAPTPYKKKIEQEKLDPDTKLPMLDEDGKVIIEEKEIKIPMYKVVSTFDVSQTEGKPLPQLASELTGNVQNYDVFTEALRRSSPVPITFAAIKREMDGFFSVDDQSITIREGMSEVQTVVAILHEISHAKLHNYQSADAPKKERQVEELEAESVAYSVAAFYKIDTGENSFGYLASWSKDKELSELRASLETIGKTSSELITDIDRHYAEIMKERGLDKIEPELATGQPVTETSEQYFEYKLHANPRSDNEKDASFIQAYEYKDGEVYPADIIGFGAYSDFIPLVNRLNDENVTTEEAVKITDEFAYKPNAPVAEIGVEEAPAVTAPENGYLPDPAMSVEAMNSYGYTDSDMLPLSKERAVELFKRDIPIYMLYEDNSEAMAFDTDEIITFDGMLGVTAADWELAPADLKEPKPDIEQVFLNNPADSYAIYQLNRKDEQAVQKSFMGMDYLEKKGLTVERSEYIPVYTDNLLYSGDTYDKLNELYTKFNISHPTDFKGHSLSVSDIVALKQSGVVSCHYVDSFGFKELPGFLSGKNPMRTVEDTVEQNDNQLDGVINNIAAPTVEELERQVKSGQSISLIDLAAAVKREQQSKKTPKAKARQSVLEKLKLHESTDKPTKTVPKRTERDV